MFLTVLVLGMGKPVLAEPGLYAECEGRIVRASTGEHVDFAAIASELAVADFVLFGERHGVREHATASACVLSALARENRPTALVMEMFFRDDQSAIDTWREAHPENAAGLGTKLEWWTRGWPAFDSWLPLLNRAFGLRVPLLGGDLSGGDATERTVSADDRAMIAQRLGNPAGAIQTSWQEAMMTAHCGLLAPEEAGKLGLHQIRRDLSMADVALAAGTKKTAVLIQTGRGHSRKDRSLYAAINQEASGSVVSIGAFTVSEKIKPADRDVHDFLWIAGSDPTPIDPCAFGDSTVDKEIEEDKP